MSDSETTAPAGWRAQVSWAPVALFPVAYGIFAMLLGQDANWDLLNYHYLDPYWAFPNHMADIAPVHGQTYISPILDVPFYFAANHLPGRVVAFLVGAWEGLAFPFLYLIGRQLIGARWLAFLLAALGMFTAGAWSEAGTVMGDAITAPFYLAGLWLIIRAIGRGTDEVGARRVPNDLLLAGALIGLGAGLKLSGAPWAIGAVAAWLVVGLPWRQRLRDGVATAAGVAAGGVVSYGYWAWQLWSHFGNPVLPFFNQFFRSPWIAAVANSDMRFVPHGKFETLFYPFIWSATSGRVSEVPFRELSLPILEGILILIVLKASAGMARRRARLPIFAGNPQRFLVAWLLVGYLLWTLIFGIYRYLIPLEMLSFILIGVFLRDLWPTHLPRVVLAGTLGLLILASLVTEVPGNWGRVAYSSRYFTVPLPTALSQHPSGVLVLGDNPMGFAIPSFPRDTFFAGVQGGGVETPLVHDLIVRKLATYPTIYAMWHDVSPDPGFITTKQDLLNAFGLRADLSNCRVINATVGDSAYPIHYCLLVAPAT